MDRVIAQLRDAYLKAGKPVSAHMDLTWRCPLSCRHCYLQTRGAPDELSTAEVVKVLRELKELGTLVLVLSGGELLLRSDLVEILEEAAASGFGIRLKTTGFGAEEGFWRRISRLGVISVDVSFYGARAQEHDWVTQRTGSFDAAVKMVAELNSHAIPVRGVLTVLKGAVEDPVAAARELALLGLRHVDYNHYSQVGCGSANAAALALGEEGDIGFMSAVLGQRPLHTQAIPPDERGCNACLLGLYVAPDGGVGPCVDFPATVGNCRTESMAVLWHRIGERIDYYNPTLAMRPKCLSCELAVYGYYCPAMARMETGNPTEPGEELCATCRSLDVANRRIGGSR